MEIANDLLSSSSLTLGVRREALLEFLVERPEKRDRLRPLGCSFFVPKDPGEREGINHATSLEIYFPNCEQLVLGLVYRPLSLEGRLLTPFHVTVCQP